MAGRVLRPQFLVVAYIMLVVQVAGVAVWLAEREEVLSEEMEPLLFLEIAQLVRQIEAEAAEQGHTQVSLRAVMVVRELLLSPTHTHDYGPDRVPA